MKKSVLDKGVSFMKTLMSYDSGLTPQMSAGIVGNLMQESSLDYQAMNSIDHKGLAQWDPNIRWPKYENWLRVNKLSDSSDSQLRYILNENPTDSMKAIKRLKESRNITAPASAALFLKWFERSGEKEGDIGYSNRLLFASEFFNHFMEVEGGMNFKKELNMPVGEWIDGRIGFQTQSEFDEVFLDTVTVKGKSMKKIAPKNIFTDEVKNAVAFGSDDQSTYFRRRL